MIAQGLIYKKVANEELEMTVFKPDICDGLLPAVIFYGGGGWAGLRLAQFEPQCESLTNNNIIGITLRYRVGSKDNGYLASDCNDDGISAYDYVCKHAIELGVDVNRIALAGGSAGGQIAAYIGYSRTYNGISPLPKALILYNAALDLKCVPDRLSHLFTKDLAKKLSPDNYFCGGCPPSILFNGTLDVLIDFREILQMQKKMNELGNVFDVHLYEGYDHGFFNLVGSEDTRPYYDIDKKVLAFLAQYLV